MDKKEARSLVRTERDTELVRRDQIECDAGQSGGGWWQRLWATSGLEGPKGSCRLVI